VSFPLTLLTSGINSAALLAGPVPKPLTAVGRTPLKIEAMSGSAIAGTVVGVSGLRAIAFASTLWTRAA
jgi:hypothetical protein